MNWMEILARGVLVVVVILFLYVLTQVIYFREGVKSTDLVQAIVGLGLLAAAAFGLNQYAQLRRPYVAMVDITAESNLARPGLLMRYPDKPTIISRQEVLNKRPSIRNAVEEILFDMTFKNTGPLAAVDCELQYAQVPGHEGKALKELWNDAEKEALEYRGKRNQLEAEKQKQLEAEIDALSNPQEKTQLVEKIDKQFKDKIRNLEKTYNSRARPLADDIVLNPQQEQTFHFMVHHKNIKPGTIIYILSDVRYNSVERRRKDDDNETADEKTQEKKNHQKNYRILNLYKIWHPEAWTVIFYPNLIRSEVDDKA